MGQRLGFLTVNRLHPAERAAVVVLTNTSDSPAFRHIADAVEYLVVPPTREDAAARAVFRSRQRGESDRPRFAAGF